MCGPSVSGRGGAVELPSLRSGFGHRPLTGQPVADCNAVVERNEERIRVAKPAMFCLLSEVSNLQSKVGLTASRGQQF